MIRVGDSALSLGTGQVLAGRYLLIAPLASGGMGQVWTARHLATGAEVAVKILRPERMSSDALVRFRREAETTATLGHRAIVRVFDLIELSPDGGPLVMVMERLRGHTLARELALHGALSVEDTLVIAFELLSGLSHAHRVGIIHRDLKPDNVFLAREPDGRRMPKIVDFGFSKRLRATPITRSGEILGTFSYMSPEQTMGLEVDQRSDVFSMGVLIYECLSGRNPFVSGSTRERDLGDLMQVFKVPPSRLDHVPPALWQVIRRAIAIRRDERFATASELSEALAAAVRAPSAKATHWSTPWIVAGAMVAVAAVIASATGGAFGSGEAQGERAPHVEASGGGRARARVAHEKRLLAGADTAEERVAPAAVVSLAAKASSHPAKAPEQTWLAEERAGSALRRRPVIAHDSGAVAGVQAMGR